MALLRRIWRDERGSQSIGATGAVLAAALIAGALLVGARLGGARVERAMQCAAAVLGVGGPICHGSPSQAGGPPETGGPLETAEAPAGNATRAWAAPLAFRGWAASSAAQGDAPLDVDALAKQYAPTLYLHPDDELKLCNATDYFGHGQMTTNHPITGRAVEVVPEGDDRWRTVDDGEAGNISAGLGADTNVQLIPPGGQNSAWCSDIAASARPEPDPNIADPHANPEIYYYYDLTTNSLTYWFFYCDDSDHEGDWEGITLYFDAQGEVAWTCYSSHSNPYCAQGAPARDAATGQPVVYASKGKHANRPSPDFEPDEGEEDEWAAGDMYDARNMLAPAAEQVWWGRDFRWGASSGLSSSGCNPNSPHTPSDQGPIGQDEVPPPNGADQGTREPVARSGVS